MSSLGELMLRRGTDGPEGSQNGWALLKRLWKI